MADVVTLLKEARDVVVEIAGRPKEVLTPGYDPNPGMRPGALKNNLIGEIKDG